MSGQLGKSLEVPGAPYRRRLTTRCGSTRSIAAGGARGVRKLLLFSCGLASDLALWVHGTLLLHGIVQVRNGQAQLRELIRLHPNAHLLGVPGLAS
jgi:hypothetical protein